MYIHPNAKKKHENNKNENQCTYTYGTHKYNKNYKYYHTNYLHTYKRACKEPYTCIYKY